MTAQRFSDFLNVLNVHRERLVSTTMAEMFDANPDRFLGFSLCLDSLVFDYSKNRIDRNSFEALIDMARSLEIESLRDAMFRGDIVNTTENRAALHVALRGSVSQDVEVDGKNVAEAIDSVLKRMRKFSSVVRNGFYTVTGGKILDVVNIGIGGSHTGPAMAARALDPFCDGPKLHFVSNVDGADLSSVLGSINPQTTLFIIASKTFTTAETMMNANTARKWLAENVGEENVGKHFAALSTNQSDTRKFGIDDERCFEFWDWVGGRYSLWSAIGLSLMIGIGPDRFDEMLSGAKTADRHFAEEPLEKNIPVIMALLGIWYRNIWNCSSHAILPYDHRLAGLPCWLQQLDMESNGKSIDRSGNPVDYDTAPVVFGEPGTNGQHAFYQLLHQGTNFVPCDFLLAANAQGEMFEHQMALAANCLAQSEALMRGKDEETVIAELVAGGMSKDQAKSLAPHKVFSGNRPSNTILYERLEPRTLGMILALYEHKAFVQGAIWNVNSFDQWGVELGKQLAADIEPSLKSGDDSEAANSSTACLIRAFAKFRE